ncbi:MAG: rhomboid family intramembrane serine protease [Fimbriimonas sp.]
MFLPIRSKNPPESLPIGTILLIIINVFVFVFTTNGWSIREEVLKAGGITANNFSALKMLTSMFLHGDWLHLAGNMWFLYLFGFAVEGRLRTLKFIPLYLIAGVTGDVMHQLLMGRLYPDMPSIGASGAIMGVLGAALWLFPHGQIDCVYGFRFSYGTVTWPLWGVALIYLGMDILFAFIGMKDGVGHLAHIGGALGGLLVCMAYRPQRDTEFVSHAKATLSETKDLSLLSPQELAEMHKVNPTDTAIVLNWMHRSLVSGRQVDPNCLAIFQKSLPQIVASHEIGPVAFCVAWLNSQPGTVPARLVIQVASRMEHQGDANTALKLYDSVLKDPQSTAGDREGALFRMGMVYESMLQNYKAATQCYNSVVQHWPMSPMAEQAKGRLKVLSAQQAAGRT